MSLNDKAGEINRKLTPEIFKGDDNIESTETNDLEEFDTIEDIDREVVEEYEVPSGFSSEEFYTTLNNVATQTEEALKSYYNTDDVKVEIVSKGRDLDEQLSHYNEGASGVKLGLHNFNAAGDYMIYIDGERIVADGTQGVAGSIEPYQILGHFARENDLFWGWGSDSGHVGKTRTVSEFIRQNPQLLEDPKYKDILKEFNITGNEIRPESNLLEPINPFE